jgi:hypothetical protein
MSMVKFIFLKRTLEISGFCEAERNKNPLD